MGKRKIIVSGIKKTFSVGYGEFKKDVTTSCKRLKPKLKKKLKEKYKRKSTKEIRESLGYGRELNLGGIYK